jgi:hypothetical protein
MNVQKGKVPGRKGEYFSRALSPTVMSANNGAGLWGGGQWGAPPNFDMHPSPSRRPVLCNGGGLNMPTGRHVEVQDS